MVVILKQWMYSHGCYSEAVDAQSWLIFTELLNNSSSYSFNGNH